MGVEHRTTLVQNLPLDQSKEQIRLNITSHIEESKKPLPELLRASRITEALDFLQLNGGVAISAVALQETGYWVDDNLGIGTLNVNVDRLQEGIARIDIERESRKISLVYNKRTNILLGAQIRTKRDGCWEFLSEILVNEQTIVLLQEVAIEAQRQLEVVQNQI